MYIRLISLLIAMSLHSALPRQLTRLFPDTASHQGKAWLGASKEWRRAFLNGYINGLLDGHRRGCSDYEKGTPYVLPTPMREKIPVEKCMDWGLNFSRTPEDYERLMTDYYKTYPEDSNLPILKLLDELSDNEHKSLSEIHRWYHSPDEPE
ncbi:MAG: hypothetical protein WBF56_09170 [Candidatus Acidiferrales bacterium]